MNKFSQTFAFFPMILAVSACGVEFTTESQADQIDTAVVESDSSEESTAEAESAVGVTHGYMSVSGNALIVPQSLVTQTPSYIAANGSGWWFCGQATMATAIDLLRGTAITSSTKVTQLEWFHQQLLANPISGYPYNQANHYEANIDALRKVTDAHPEFVVPAKVYTSTRSVARDGIMAALDSGYLVVALSRIQVGGVWYGHYKALYKVVYDASLNTGGDAYYADVYHNSPIKQAFSLFLDDMGAMGASSSSTGTPHWSYLKIKKQ